MWVTVSSRCTRAEPASACTRRSYSNGVFCPAASANEPRNRATTRTGPGSSISIESAGIGASAPLSSVTLTFIGPTTSAVPLRMLSSRAVRFRRTTAAPVEMMTASPSCRALAPAVEPAALPPAKSSVSV
jgi:hypothetical protein